MNPLPVLILLAALLNTTWNTAVVARRMLIEAGREPPAALRVTVTVLTWPALVAALAQPVITVLAGMSMSWQDWFRLISTCVFWWIFRKDGDDDMWKRLKDRATGRIERLGSRLVIVAEPA